MNELKATPGPWMPAVVDGGWDAVCEKDNRESVICSLKLNNSDNAHLIAAAPEMYEALENCIGYIEMCSPHPCEASDMAKEVLKKARGEEVDR